MKTSCIVFNIVIVILPDFCKKLQNKSFPFRFILLKQFKKTMIIKKTGSHHAGNINFFLPLNPFGDDPVIYFRGDVIYEHSLWLNFKIYRAMVAMPYLGKKFYIFNQVPKIG